jgi:hypothetical protein
MSLFRMRGKPLPTLTEYLHHLVRGTPEQHLVAGIATLGGLLCIVGFVGTLLIGTIPFIAYLIAVAMFGRFAATWFARSSKRHGEDPRFQLRQEAKQIAKQMIASKRLHKDLEGASAQLLEEGARYWREIKVELDTPAWRNPSLAAHWQGVRNQLSGAADVAMEEMLVILRGSFHPNFSPNGWENVVEDAIETFVTGPKLRKGERIPPGFVEARQIAEKLKIAASQVKNASLEVTAETAGTPPVLHSGAALDLVIGDMKSYQEAEQELRKNLNA